jgi:type II secretory pathway component PulK
MRQNRRGFILLFALGIVAVVGVAILALASLQSYDGRRTAGRIREAQLEQMLLAGALEAPQHFVSVAPAKDQLWSIDLPPALASQGGSLRSRVTSVQNDVNVSVLISATLDGKSAQQTLTFARQENQWKLTAARLGAE